MEFLRYKTYVWPQNPHTYQERYVREPQYHTENGVVIYDGMGLTRQVVTGSGVFFGEDAFEWFRELATVFADAEMGDLYHPLWGIRSCYFTELELTQEPRDNCVSYKFEFTCALPNGAVPR